MPAVQSSEFNAAFRSLHKGHSILSLIILLCLAAQIASFYAVEFGGVLKGYATTQCTVAATPVAETPTTAPAVTPTTEPTTTAPAVTPAEDVKAGACKTQCAENWQYALNWALAASKIVAFAAAIFLFVLQTVAGHLSLLGPGVRGIKQIISSICWTVILLVMVTPWQQILRPSHVCGATFNLGDIVHCQSIATGAGLSVLVSYYARFLAYPALALLVWLAVVVKFGRGYRRLTSPQPTVAAVVQ